MSDGTASTGRWLKLASGPVLALGVFLLTRGSLPLPAAKVLAVTVWTAAWWVTEAIPIPATSLLPAFLLPTLGVCTADKAANYYAHWLILLLLGGFIIARAIEASGLHRRIALRILGAVGESRRRLVFGFLISSAMLSMWISNTATTLMLLPIALSVIGTVEAPPGSPTPPADPAPASSFSIALLLAIAYGANVGGVGTLIGTPPNLIFANAIEELGQTHPEIPIGLNPDFPSWLGFGIPVVLIFIPLIGFLLTRVFFRLPGGASRSVATHLEVERRALGPMAPRELRVLLIFIGVAALWIFRGGPSMPGWSTLLVELGWFDAETASKFLRDSSVALLGALLMFIVPRERGSRQGLLEWREVESVPWGMLLLFGGGFAIAGEFEASGLSDVIGAGMATWVSWPGPALIGTISLAVTFLTEITSNTASTNMLMPILSSAAVAGKIPPLVLLLPAVLSVSFAFMLPVATAPNAIVFSTGRVPILSMVRCGFFLNLLGPLVVLFVMYAIVRPLYGLPF